LYLLPGAVEHTVYNPFAAGSVNAADVDGDGDIDVLGGGIITGMVWFENTGGTGTSWTRHTVDSSFYYGVEAVSAADIDDDGDMDVLGAASNQGDITWWENADGFGLEWTGFSADYLLAEGTSVSFQFRSSDTWEVMGEWSEEIMLPDTSLLEILQDSTRFIQYRVNLGTCDPFNTPVLNSISVSYVPYSGTGSFDREELEEFRIEPYDNPCLNGLSFSMHIPASGIVEVTIFDLSGRSVHESTTFAEAGSHRFNLDSVSSGYYFCLVKYGDSEITFPILVLH